MKRKTPLLPPPAYPPTIGNVHAAYAMYVAGLLPIEALMNAYAKSGKKSRRRRS